MIYSTLCGVTVATLHHNADPVYPAGPLALALRQDPLRYTWMSRYHLAHALVRPQPQHMTHAHSCISCNRPHQCVHVCCHLCLLALALDPRRLQDDGFSCLSGKTNMRAFSLTHLMPNPPTDPPRDTGQGGSERWTDPRGRLASKSR